MFIEVVHCRVILIASLLWAQIFVLVTSAHGSDSSPLGPA